MNKPFLDKNPKVSVITACYNAQKYIERSMRSLQAQTYKNIEHIIIDGGSTDQTLEILKKHKNKIALLITEPDKGIYDAMNKGIRHATGDILYFFNTDDRLYSPDIIEMAVDFFEKKKSDFIYGDIVNDYIDDKHFTIGRYPGRVVKRYFLRNSIAHPATFFHKRCFEKVGYYDVRYKIASDYEWYLRALCRHGLRCAHIGRIISIFQCGGVSTNDVNKNLILSERDFIQKIYFSPSETHSGKIINFFYYGDYIRAAARFALGRKGYNFLSKVTKETRVNG